MVLTDFQLHPVSPVPHTAGDNVGMLSPSPIRPDTPFGSLGVRLYSPAHHGDMRPSFERSGESACSRQTPSPLALRRNLHCMNTWKLK